MRIPSTRIIDADGKQSVGFALHATGAVTVAIVLGLYYAFVYQGLAVCQANDAQRIDQLNLLLGESASIQRAHNRLQEELGALEAAVGEIRKRLPHDLRQEEFTTDLARVAEAVGLHLDELQWGIPQVSPTHAEATVQVNCSGSFASVCRFLEGVSQLARITDVAQLTMDADAESADHTFQVGFILYYDDDPRDSDKNAGGL